MARWCKVKVLRFSIGFGRIVWSRRFGPDRTEWAVSAIPLGGYVKMLDEREGAVAAADLPRAFNRQSVGKRIAIVAAGPDRQPAARGPALCRHLHRRRSRRSARSSPRLPPSTPAAVAGMREGDLVVAVDGVAGPELAGPALAPAARVGRDATIAIDVERPDGARRAAHACRWRRSSAADWEGNFMPMLGFRSDLGPPLIDEVAAGQAGGARGTSRRRPDRRDRRRDRALAGRGRGEDQCPAGRAR